MNSNFWIEDIKSLRIGELKKLIKLYEDNGKDYEAEKTTKKLESFIDLCAYGTEAMILEELSSRLSDFYQVLAGYYYAMAEDFNYNPLIKIDRLKKAVIMCQKLKEHTIEAVPYANKYICQTNRNYLR